MVDYPFDEKQAFIDREGFEALGKRFAVVDDPSNNRGYWIFKWNSGWETLGNLPVKELCQFSPYLFAFGSTAFHLERGYLSSGDGFSSEKLLDVMKKRGITRDTFLEYAGDFEFRTLGPESTQIIAAIAYDLESESAFAESSHASHWYGVLRQNFQKNSERLEAHNKGKKSPFSLDQILAFENEPACLRFSDDGRLYVLDTEAVLHEFTGAKKTREWALWMRNGMQSINEVSLMDGFQSFPNIAIAGDHAFVVTGGLIRYNLSQHNQWDGKVAIDANVYTDNEMGRIVHDVVIKDRNAFISMSHECGGKRYIAQAESQRDNIQFRLIYEGRFPIGFVRNSMEDHTLRMDIHKGHLFFPRSTGISLYRGTRPDGQKPKEMLVGYANPEEPYNPVNPITKFSFGDGFMVAQALLQGFEIPMLCVFRPVYEQSTELVPAGMTPAPDRFELDYIGYAPKITGATLMNASVSAHGNKFAVTNSTFKRVFVYQMQEAGM